MHDTAVGTANFTECMPAPTDEGSRSPATEGGWTRSQPIACNGVHQVVGGRLRWHQNL